MTTNSKNDDAKKTWRTWLIKKLLTSQTSKDDILQILGEISNENLSENSWTLLENNFIEQDLGNNLAVDFSDIDSFYNMVNNTWKPTNNRLSENIWRYSVRPIDNNLKWVEKEEKDYSTTLKQTHNGRVDFDFCISIYFPEKNLPIIIERLKTYNEGDD